MKIFICIILLLSSFIFAYKREQYFLSRLSANNLFKELANKLRENSYTSIKPVFEVINAVLKSDGIVYDDNIEYHEIINIFKEYTKNAFGAAAFTDALLEFNNATLSDVDERCQELNKIAEKNYENALAEYEKCKNTVFWVYPGIAAMIALLII